LKENEAMNMDSTSKAQKQEAVSRRALSESFFEQFKDGIFKPLVDRVRLDKDLDLEFRGSYINVYYQGHSILNLDKNGNVKIDAEFKRKIDNLPERLKNMDVVSLFLSQIPQIKDNVVYRPQELDENKRISRSREVEFEQLLIRSNNLERRNNSDYIIIDRQYVVNNRKDRWDLIALRYPPKGSPKGYLSIIEVKYAQNPDIKEIKLQVERYGDYLEKHFPSICSDMTNVLKQKLDLRLVVRSSQRIEWLKRLCADDAIDRNLESAEIIVYLIDYSCNSNLKTLAQKSGRPKFRGNIKIALGGLALWQDNMTDWKK